LGGAAYVVLFIVGVIVGSAGQPDTGSAPEKLVSYYSDSGHRDKIFFGWILVVLGVFLFLWFLGSLRQALLRQEPDGFLPAVASIGGIVYAALTLVGWALQVAVKTMSDDTYQHTVYPPLIHAADDAGYVLHATGGIGAGTMMIAASLVALRAGTVASWLGWVGVAAGVIALASIAFFPMALIGIWLLVVAIGLFVRGGQGAQSAPR
jgi:hypothetical protein